MLILALVCLVVDYVPFMKSVALAGKARLANEKEIKEAYSVDQYTKKHSTVAKKDVTLGKRALLWCMIFIMMSLSASISFVPM